MQRHPALRSLSSELPYWGRIYPRLGCPQTNTVDTKWESVAP